MFSHRDAWLYTFLVSFAKKITREFAGKGMNPKAKADVILGVLLFPTFPAYR